jgi:UDP-N-acetylmuramoyl-tripeptide--D-alanyl-D-alanine ligase
MLNLLAYWVYRKYKPTLVLVSGTDGKSTVLAMLYQCLSKKKRVFATSYHYSHFFGIPLTFLLLGEKNFWKILLQSLKLLFCRVNYPDYLLLEFGFESPALVDYWLKKLHINYLIITSIGKIPAFVEVFAGPEQLQAKKVRLIQAVQVDGAIFLNADDYSLFELSTAARAPVFLFGLSQSLNDSQQAGVGIIAKNVELICNPNSAPSICGTRFTLMTTVGQRPVFLRNLFGKGVVYACLAAAGLLQRLNFSLDEIAMCLEEFSGLPHRLSLHKSPYGYFVLDDSHHISEASFRQALAVLRQLPAKRKILVLGDILNIGKYALEAHQSFGEEVAETVDYLVTVGVKSKFTQEAAIEAGLKQNQAKHFFQTEVQALTEFLKGFLRVGDLVLIIGDYRLKLTMVAEALL